MNPVAEIARKPRLLVKDGSVKTTSLAVASYFNRNHSDVIKAIRGLIQDCPREWHQRNFALMSYLDKAGQGAQRMQPMYEMTRDGFVLLVMGFTGKEALLWKIHYIEACNAMERTLAERGLVAGSLPEMDRAGMWGVHPVNT